MTTLALRFAIVLAVALPGCATTVHEIPATYAPGDAPDSVVIGRLVVELAGPEGVKPLPFFEGLTHLHMTVKNQTTGTHYEIVCEESGSDARFHVALPPGEYTLVRVMMNQLEALPDGAFTVPSRDLVYIGTLRFRKGGFAESLAVSVLSTQTTYLGDWCVEDASAEAISTFHGKYPQLTGPVKTSLIRILD